MNKNKRVKKTNTYSKVAIEMAKEIANLVNFIGMESPSDRLHDMEEILDSYVNQKRAEVLRKKINGMAYSKVKKLEENVNNLLSRGNRN